MFFHSKVSFYSMSHTYNFGLHHLKVVDILTAHPYMCLHKYSENYISFHKSTLSHLKKINDYIISNAYNTGHIQIPICFSNKSIFFRLKISWRVHPLHKVMCLPSPLSDPTSSSLCPLAFLCILLTLLKTPVHFKDCPNSPTVCICGSISSYLNSDETILAGMSHAGYCT